jgi:hypothetical protein
MGLFSITKDVVLKLLGLLDNKEGLVHGAGSKENNTFCVQQAVSLATGLPGKDDQPKHCVMPWLINLGIHLNDSLGWDSDQSRAEGLREFAVAELGSNTLRESSLRRNLREKMKAKWPEHCEEHDLDEMSTPDIYVNVAEEEGEEGLRALCDMVVDILQDMNSPGSEYLFLANRKKYERPEELKGVRIPKPEPATEEVKKSAWIADDAPWEDPKAVN